MSTLALMRWLETTPKRYDKGMHLLTLGRVSSLRDRLVDMAVTGPNCQVLEIGCGTGAVTELLSDRGVEVTAIDQNPAMLELARQRLQNKPDTNITFIECTAAEIDSLPEQSYDAVIASLSLSEMSPSERAFVLHQAALRLKPGGRLVVGDEVRPRISWQRFINLILRAPQALLGWLLVGSISHPIPDLAGELCATGLKVVHEDRWLQDTLAVVTAAKNK
jgi:demethylmenaquinone methyltransferase/2-methoxy-6-polyprenyl-1,4-benzoquinol methylase|tara:strand:+ start:7012 stop:7671 length:660 start_codon:yes stop_codon:yes gene_type:complete